MLHIIVHTQQQHSHAFSYPCMHIYLHKSDGSRRCDDHDDDDGYSDGMDVHEFYRRIASDRKTMIYASLQHFS